MGAIGFVLTLIAMVGFCIWPLLLLGALGLLLCMVAMFKAPRALAIVGFILGLIETAVLALLVFIFGSLVFFGVLLVGSLGEYVTSFESIMKIGEQVEKHRAEHGTLPLTLDQLSGFDRNDPWGNPYQYEIKDGGDYRVGTWGPDGKPDTYDDFYLDRNIFEAVNGQAKGGLPGGLNPGGLNFDPNNPNFSIPGLPDGIPAQPDEGDE